VLADFSDQDLRGASFRRARLGGGTKFWRANLEGADFSESIGANNFTGANLTNAKLHRRERSRTFAGVGRGQPAAILDGAVFRGVRFEPRLFFIEQEGFTSADVTRANLEGAILVCANLVQKSSAQRAMARASDRLDPRPGAAPPRHRPRGQLPAGARPRGRAMKRAARIAALVPGIVAAWTQAGWACSCARVSAEDIFRQAGSIFVGTVLETRILNSSDPLSPVATRVTVEEVIKGGPGPEVIIGHITDDGRCGVQFRPGERRTFTTGLVVDGRTSTGLCGQIGGQLPIIARFRALVNDTDAQVSAHPGEPGPVLARAALLEAWSDLDGALADYRQASAAWPQEEGGWFGEGRILFRLSRLDQAIPALARAVALSAATTRHAGCSTRRACARAIRPRSRQWTCGACGSRTASCRRMILPAATSPARACRASACAIPSSAAAACLMSVSTWSTSRVRGYATWR
jgi:hypothetical protein